MDEITYEDWARTWIDDPCDDCTHWLIFLLDKLS